ncbi:MULTISPECIES: trigger factor [unclassified Campylobacter]|uniref:trigger factor n=1 Tax=unclassified Campylobacter TaxID=2593542 RepID=UPI001237EBEE|nr:MULTISPECIES: trigger factor [unclassified Campylobacter]KAA6225124.1 trigger factor [Campylobacter sp. LR196d]KAA6226138.1 trigger factor [Campylobacter sp. LR185c]KAA6228086.1 trigger factor [Campylobacter sp. LR286c]KAA6231550.1 trigger factor [Campylobacter sp. LR291e]KAA8604637.1 trigger factor [Campylobacter sp. LR185c]
MQVKATQLDSVNANVDASISSTAMQTQIQKLAKEASKSVKMDGFRPGHVPVNAVLKRYAKELKQDAEQRLLKEVIDLALKELKKDTTELVGQPYFEKFEQKDNGIETKLVLSFRPKIELNEYEKLIPNYEIPKASKEEFEEKKNQLLRRYATTETVDKQSLEEKDFAKFDFEGFVDGIAFDGGKAENYVLEIGSKQFIPGFEDGMIGMKKGEEKEIKVKFPDNYNAKNLAGKEAIFKVKLHEIQVLKMPEINDELLKKLLPNEEKPSIELLDKQIEEQIHNEKLYKLINEELKSKFVDSLIEKFDFDLPHGIVEQETDIQFRNAWVNFSDEERQSFAKDKDKAKEKRDSFKDDAKKSVKLTFIVDELARLRKIEVSDQELVQAVYFEAYRYGMNPNEHLENYKKQGALPALKMALVEEKLFQDIFIKK